MKTLLLPAVLGTGLLLAGVAPASAALLYEPFNYTPPETRTIPYGESCSPAGGSSGYSVVNTRIIKDLSGKVIREEPFTTVYNGQVQVICEPPPPTPTPASTAPAVTTPAPAPSG